MKHCKGYVQNDFSLIWCSILAFCLGGQKDQVNLSWPINVFFIVCVCHLMMLLNAQIIWHWQQINECVWSDGGMKNHLQLERNLSQGHFVHCTSKRDQCSGRDWKHIKVRSTAAWANSLSFTCDSVTDYTNPLQFICVWFI